MKPIITKIDDSTYSKITTVEEIIDIKNAINIIKTLTQSRDIVQGRINDMQAEMDDAVKKGVKLPSITPLINPVAEVVAEPLK